MKLKLSKQNQYVLMASLAAVNLVLIAVFAQGLFKHHASVDKENFDLSAIANKNLDFRQLNNFFTELANEKGGEYAYHALSYAANSNLLPGNIDVHLLGHAVGDVLYKQEGMEGIKVCTDDLRNACSHSIVVGTLLESGTEVLPQIVQLCKQAPGGKGAYTMCVHGLGHGVLAFAAYDMVKAMEICKQTGTQEFHNSEIGQCVGGMTMEMVAGVHDRDAWEKQYKNIFKEGDPLSPCNEDYIPDNAKSFCYTYLTPRLLAAAGADLGNPDPKYYPKAFSYCELIPKSRTSDRSTCFASFGKEFAVLANDRNPQTVEIMSNEKLIKIYDWCNSGPSKEGLTPCLNSALQSLYWGGENTPGVSIRFCEIIPDKKESESCMNGLIAAVAYYMSSNTRAKQSFCEEIPAAYQETCRTKLLRNS